MNISDYPFEQRLEIEDQKLREDRSIVLNYTRENNIFILQFNIKSESFTLKCILNPNKFPNCYWIGPPPNHRFYINGKNIADTRFGIYTLWYTPDKTIIDIVERIIYSLTVKGEKEMEYGMF
jgi:phage terminase large subunit-like protein